MARRVADESLVTSAAAEAAIGAVLAETNEA